MKIQITEGNRKVIVEHSKDAMTVGEVVANLFRPAMLGMQYQDGSLDKEIGEFNEDDLILD